MVASPLETPPLELQLHNPVYSSSAEARVKSHALASDYELPPSNYEVIKEKEELGSTYATIEPQAVYHVVSL